MTTGKWVGLIVGLIVVAAAALFTVQNWSRATDLSFDFVAGAYKTARPTPIPVIIGISFASGLVLGLVAWVKARLDGRSRVAELERKLGRAKFPEGSGDWT